MTAAPLADVRPLDRAIALAHATAAHLAHADAGASLAYRHAISIASVGPLPLRRVREDQARIAATLLADLTPVLDAAWVELEVIDGPLSTQERALAVAAWRAAVLPYFLRVPLGRRSLDKPLGYPGDYGMVQMIFDPPGDVGDPLGRALTQYTAAVGPCRAHRQRRPWAIGHLAERRDVLGRPLRVLSYACGPEHTLRTWTTDAPETRVFLYDTEPRALRWCQDRFAEQDPRTEVSAHLVEPAALTDGTVDLTAAAPVDLVLVLGLFDYLKPGDIGALVDRLVSALAPGGRLLCTNLHTTNPWRTFMEYIGAWQVRHRGQEELTGLVVRDRKDLRVVDARLDDSGTNAYLAVERRIAL